MLLTTRTNSHQEAIDAPQARRGTTMMEYLMMISLILTVCLVGIGYLGSSNNVNMSNSANSITKSLKKSS